MGGVVKEFKALKSSNLKPFLVVDFAIQSWGFNRK